MTSEIPSHAEAFVWTWLPGANVPVVAGRLHARDGVIVFNYGQSYLRRKEAVPLYLPELPLTEGALPLLNGLTIPGSIRDGAPDAWGRRVILNRTFGLKGEDLGGTDLPELTFLLESGSDRIGALDFQLSPKDYVARSPVNATLDELMRSAERVERGIPLTPELDRALHHGSSIGGARPKALIEDGDRKYVAKFSSSSDIINVVKAEFIAMRLAADCGLSVAPVKLVRAAGKDVLLVERFDRVRNGKRWHRLGMVSALTVLELDEMMARYASYEDLAGIVRKRFTASQQTLRELFGRIVFNVLCGNTDDHARNHAAFWDGGKGMLTLTPAYDICPQGRSGQEATQAMLISGNDRMSRIASCLAAAHHFHLSPAEARAVVESQLTMIGTRWRAVCDEASLGVAERNAFVGRQFLNPYAFTGLGENEAGIAVTAEGVLGML